MSVNTIARYHELLHERKFDGLQELLADDAEFYSPILNEPKKGKGVAFMYLNAALEVLVNDDFNYVREVVSGNSAVIELETEIDGAYLNVADLISWNAYCEITEFKVMVRPLEAIQLLHDKMNEQFENSN